MKRLIMIGVVVVFVLTSVTAFATVPSFHFPVTQCRKLPVENILHRDMLWKGTDDKCYWVTLCKFEGKLYMEYRPAPYCTEENRAPKHGGM